MPVYPNRTPFKRAVDGKITPDVAGDALYINSENLAKLATVVVGKSGAVDYLTTDYGSDDACIQAAIDYVSGLDYGRVLIREGTFNTIATVNGKVGVLIEGSGIGTIVTSTSAIDLFKFEKLKNVGLSNIKLVGDDANVLVGLNVVDVWNSEFRNIDISDCTDGMRVASDNATWGSYWNTFQTIFSTSNISNGILLEKTGAGISTNANVFSNIHCADNDDGIRIDDGRQNRFIGIDCSNNTNYGLYIGDSFNSVYGGLIESNGTGLYRGTKQKIDIKEVYYWNNTVDTEDSTVSKPEDSLDNRSAKNLIRNPIMDSWESSSMLDMWTQRSITVARESSDVLTGLYSAKITANGTWSHVYCMVPRFSEYKNKWVTMSARVKALSTNTQSNAIVVHDGVTAHTVLIPKDDAWHIIQNRIPVSATASQLKVSLYVNNSAVSDSDDIIYVDSVSLVEGEGIGIVNSIPFVEKIGLNTFTDADATPSVLTELSALFMTANTGSTSITNFDAGYQGQRITIHVDDVNTTIVDNATINIRGGSNLKLDSGDTITFVRSGTVWYEISRNVAPVGNFTAPSVPATTVNYTNAYGYPCQVQVYGGTVSEIDIDDIATGLTAGVFIIPPSGTINITYSAVPSWRWWGL